MFDCAFHIHIHFVTEHTHTHPHTICFMKRPETHAKMNNVGNTGSVNKIIIHHRFPFPKAIIIPILSIILYEIDIRPPSPGTFALAKVLRMNKTISTFEFIIKYANCVFSSANLQFKILSQSVRRRSSKYTEIML